MREYNFFLIGFLIFRAFWFFEISLLKYIKNDAKKFHFWKCKKFFNLGATKSHFLKYKIFFQGGFSYFFEHEFKCTLVSSTLYYYNTWLSCIKSRILIKWSNCQHSESGGEERVGGFFSFLLDGFGSTVYVVF